MNLWITYAWKDNDEGNFDYLVQELQDFGIDTKYDKVALIPGQRLWSQITEKINDSETSGWAYLITPNSLSSQPCLEELAYALNRSLSSKNANFPLIGLVADGVSFDDIPTSLKVRLCVSLADPDWKEKVKAGLEIRPSRQVNNPQTKYIYNISQDFNGTDLVTTIEIRPRFGELHFWRIAVPQSSNVMGFGVGPASTGQTTGILEMSVEGELKVGNHNCKVVGGGSRLSSGTSAYILLKNDAPDFVAFVLAKEAFGMPTEMEVLKLK